MLRNQSGGLEPLEPRTFFNATGWVDTIDNPFMPMVPGMTWLYKGSKDGEPLKDRVVVQSYTKQVAGVTCTVVLDRSYVNGKLEERTHDYFAQDFQGSVWYFGEDTAELNSKGHVISTEGSFLAGVNGASAGIVMEAHPINGDLYQQEFASGIAEDQAKIIGVHKRIKTPFGTFNDCVKTEEFSKLEPTVAEQKYYAPGIGFIFSASTAGESEFLKLVSFFP